MTLTPSLHSLVSHKRTEVSAEFQRLNVLLLRAGTGRRIGTALLTDARVQVDIRRIFGVNFMQNFTFFLDGFVEIVQL